MLSIGNKKYRNLQEQVGYNTECIEKLSKAIDGITIEDKLVIIESDSGTFTDEELLVLSGPLAFISNGSRVWMKDSETLLELVFKAIDIKADEVASAYFNIGGSKIVVNREYGVYNTSSDTIITTYSKSQIDSIIANIYSLMDGKASLSGASFSGDVSAKTLKQNEANWKIDVINFPNIAGGVSTPIFCRVQQINQELHIVMVGKITNNSGGQINAYSTTSIEIELPENIASKIFDVLGNSAHSAPLTTTRISYSYASATTSPSSDMSKYLNDVCMNVLNMTSSNKILIMFQRNNQMTINDGDELFLEARVSLDLI